MFHYTGQCFTHNHSVNVNYFFSYMLGLQKKCGMDLGPKSLVFPIIFSFILLEAERDRCIEREMDNEREHSYVPILSLNTHNGLSQSRKLWPQSTAPTRVPGTTLKSPQLLPRTALIESCKSAAWARNQIQYSDLGHRHPHWHLNHWTRYPSLP